ncbi:MAG: dihydrofolate reductase [Candidatus Izemoplasmatales bacterium]|nr:dihydrofolate reductase [Candidatus Izemoplasmatales bacterium]
MISLIFATDPNFLIGKDNDLPWDYKEDLKYFKSTTSGKTVLMGLETFKSIHNRLGKPLPNRKSVVASLDPFTYEGVLVIHDLFAYIKAPHDEEIFVIGGKTIYELSLPYADRLYITHIKKVHDGNVYLKKIDLSNYKVIKFDEREDLIFAVYERIA